MRSIVRALFGVGLLLAIAASANAGPIIIDGTDANDHGSVGPGGNQFGWLYMQRALESLAAQLGVGPAHAVLTLGLTGNAGSEDALDAYNSAFGLSSLPGAGWTTSNADGAAAIATALAGLGTATTGILHIPTYNLIDDGGDLTAAEMAAVNAGAVQIAAFVNSGGALFAMGESGTGAWGWLTTLIPGLVVTDLGGGGEGNNITLTAAGATAFPSLSNADLAGADPWHNYFSGSLGSLAVLGTSPSGGLTRNVILGGGTGATITPGVIPEPASMLLLGTGVAALYGRVRRSKKAR
jgi:PEP-CTERM motif